MSGSRDLGEIKFDLKIVFTHVFERNFEFLLGLDHRETDGHDLFLLGILDFTGIRLTVFSELTLHGPCTDNLGDLNLTIK